jgi:hypothetical protein
VRVDDKILLCFQAAVFREFYLEGKLFIERVLEFDNLFDLFSHFR